MRIAIELRADVNPEIMLNNLFKHTQMQINFGAIMLALVDGHPRILNLRQILYYYLKYQEEVVTRRTQYELDKAKAKAHILEGLLIALDNIDEVIQIIRSSYDNARENLMNRFHLDEVQAQAICDMRLIALQGLNREKLEASAGQARSLALDLYDQWKTMNEDGKWRFTSPTHVVLAFSKALDELEAEGGIPARHRRYAENNRLLIEKMRAMGFAPYIDGSRQGPIITTFFYPAGVPFQFSEFYTYIKERGYVLYPGKLTDADTFRAVSYTHLTLPTTSRV